MYLIIFTFFFIQSFCVASQEKFFDAIRYKNANIEITYKAFLNAVIDCKTEEAEQFLKADPTLLHQKDKYGRSPLHWAVLSNSLEMVSLLIKYHAEIEEKDAQGNTSLHIAAQYGLEKIVDLLIKSGASLEAQNTFGSTPLHNAVDMNKKEVVLLLLQMGSSVNKKNYQGRTPLDKAKKWENVETIEILEKYAACAETKTDSPERKLPLKENKLS